MISTVTSGAVRIISVGYRSVLSTWTNAVTQPLPERSKKFLRKLEQAHVGRTDWIPVAAASGDHAPESATSALRMRLRRRKVIFVCHSMGGLLVKQMLADAQADPAYRHIFENTAGSLHYSCCI